MIRQTEFAMWEVSWMTDSVRRNMTFDTYEYAELLENQLKWWEENFTRLIDIQAMSGIAGALALAEVVDEFMEEFDGAELLPWIEEYITDKGE